MAVRLPAARSGVPLPLPLPPAPLLQLLLQLLLFSALCAVCTGTVCRETRQPCQPPALSRVHFEWDPNRPSVCGNTGQDARDKPQPTHPAPAGRSGFIHQVMDEVTGKVYVSFCCLPEAKKRFTCYDAAGDGVESGEGGGVGGGGGGGAGASESSSSSSSSSSAQVAVSVPRDRSKDALSLHTNAEDFRRCYETLRDLQEHDLWHYFWFALSGVHSGDWASRMVPFHRDRFLRSDFYRQVCETVFTLFRESEEHRANVAYFFTEQSCAGPPDPTFVANFMALPDTLTFADCDLARFTFASMAVAADAEVEIVRQKVGLLKAVAAVVAATVAPAGPVVLAAVGGAVSVLGAAAAHGLNKGAFQSGVIGTVRTLFQGGFQPALSECSSGSGSGGRKPGLVRNSLIFSAFKRLLSVPPHVAESAVRCLPASSAFALNESYRFKGLLELVNLFNSQVLAYKAASAPLATDPFTELIRASPRLAVQGLPSRN